MYRVSSVEGELSFYDMMLAWYRIIQKKYDLIDPTLFGCCLNEFASDGEFVLSYGSINDFFVKGVDAWIDYSAMPIRSESIKFIVSTSLVESSSSLASLAEFYRVLDFGGYIIFFYFRKSSLGYVQKIFDSEPTIYPSFHSTTRLRHMLARVGFDVLVAQPVSYRPFVKGQNFGKYLSMEIFGSTLFPFMSTCSLILAKKQHIPLTPDLKEMAI